MRKKYSKSRNYSYFIVIIAAILLATLFLAARNSDSRLDKIMQEFHQAGSEENIKEYFPDAQIISEEQRDKSSFRYYYTADENRTIIFRYYFLEGENKTVVACDRNVTIAICPGRVEKLTAEDVEKCLVAESTAIALTGNTTKP